MRGGGLLSPFFSLCMLLHVCGQTVTTLAGRAGVCGETDGWYTNATFCDPEGVALDVSSGMVLVSGGFSNNVRIVFTGMVRTIAGGQSGSEGNADGSATAASFNRPHGAAFAGNVLYLADSGNCRIRAVTVSLPGEAIVVRTIAGGAINGYNDGKGTAATFNQPQGVAVTATGTLYVADTGNNRVRAISPDGTVTTLAGNGSASFADGSALSSSFNQPINVAVDEARGIVYLSDAGNYRLRAVHNGLVTTVAGTGATTLPVSDGVGTSVVVWPKGLSVTNDGSLVFGCHNTVRVLSRSGLVTTLAGSGKDGSADGFALNATFLNPMGIAASPTGSVVYVSDSWNSNIRAIYSKNTPSVSPLPPPITLSPSPTPSPYPTPTGSASSSRSAHTTASYAPFVPPSGAPASPPVVLAGVGSALGMAVLCICLRGCERRSQGGSGPPSTLLPAGNNLVSIDEALAGGDYKELEG